MIWLSIAFVAWAVAVCLFLAGVFPPPHRLFRERDTIDEIIAQETARGAQLLALDRASRVRTDTDDEDAWWL